MDKKAISELIKHVLANGLFHFVLGSAGFTIIAIALPLNIPVHSLYDALQIGGIMGVMFGVIGAFLAIENEDGNNLDRFAVMRWLKRSLWEKGSNGERYVVSEKFGLTVRARTSWKGYLLYLNI